MKFPSNFKWGAATASYQIEGAATADGKGPSIWDIFSHTPGKIANNENGDIACDHFNKFKEDIAILKELGIKNYRFSISWPRIIPDGDGNLNPLGFRFYDELVNELLKNKITPYITLYHWDLPQALYEKGGFWWDGISDAFANYASVVVKHFADRVNHFATINEAQIIVKLGYEIGVHAPGEVHSQETLGPVMRNVLLCHGKAVKAIREAHPDALVSAASTGVLCYPSTDSPADYESAKANSFPTSGENLLFSHNWFLDPVCLGENHIDFLELSKEDMTIIHQPLDYIGINIYNGHEYNANGYVERYTGFPRTSLGWPVCEDVMEYGLYYLYERYGLPIYITENGQACNDRLFLDGKVHDMERIDFIERYLNSLSKAIDRGADIRGYFYWSLLDNLEWHTGYDPRFGIVFVDYSDSNLKRTIKDSGYYYRDIIKKFSQ